ncbi:YbjQ family protein [Roseovarius sp. SCSIO 43702]|uniref:YbjQ family protein n=1 Tax=Roseovarius sp. SCSIO 43702 TaxID=2823043 RepID=UPI001C73893A|nr:YbjQ family protein [Roseovarius sp. SCSIO 43702]QYX55667.1 YbjQ family protein [Roseovarius sp. SCSIO 43702]
MLITTTPDIAGHTITETLGLARGSTVRAKHIGTDIVASLKNLVGGEVRGYSSLMAGAREQALDRMIEDARRMGADAVVAIRIETATIAQGASEIVAYGTAVRLDPPLPGR